MNKNERDRGHRNKKAFSQICDVTHRSVRKYKQTLVIPMEDHMIAYFTSVFFQ